MSTAIPKVVHWIWLGPPIPDDLLALTERFIALHPDWEMQWWREEQIDAFRLRNRRLYDAAERIVPPDSVEQFRSDIARYEILQRQGGMYLDLDYDWRKPIDPHLAGHDLVSGWELQHRWVANGLIAARPGHPAMEEAIAGIPARIASRHPSWRANRLTGPHLWTPIAKRHAHLLHQDVLHPVPWNKPEWAWERDFPDATAVHLFAHQKALRGLEAPRGER